jgi:hypothetical protein
MPPARLMVLAGSIWLLAGVPGCGAGAAKTSRQPAAAPEAAASPEAAPLQQSPGYSSKVQQAPGSTTDLSPESSEEEAREQPSSLGEPAAEDDEAIEPDTLADANALLTRANERLDILFGRRKKSEAAAGAGSRLSTGSSDCLEACKAFASLRRAADAICRIAGETTRRCKKARAAVDENAERVAVCGCEEE